MTFVSLPLIMSPLLLLILLLILAVGFLSLLFLPFIWELKHPKEPRTTIPDQTLYDVPYATLYETWLLSEIWLDLLDDIEDCARCPSHNDE